MALQERPESQGKFPAIKKNFPVIKSDRVNNSIKIRFTVHSNMILVQYMHSCSLPARVPKEKKERLFVRVGISIFEYRYYRNIEIVFSKFLNIEINNKFYRN